MLYYIILYITVGIYLTNGEQTEVVLNLSRVDYTVFKAVKGTSTKYKRFIITPETNYVVKTVVDSGIKVWEMQEGSLFVSADVYYKACLPQLINLNCVKALETCISYYKRENGKFRKIPPTDFLVLSDSIHFFDNTILLDLDYGFDINKNLFKMQQITMYNKTFYQYYVRDDIFLTKITNLEDVLMDSAAGQILMRIVVYKAPGIKPILEFVIKSADGTDTSVYMEQNDGKWERVKKRRMMELYCDHPPPPEPDETASTDTSTPEKPPALEARAEEVDEFSEFMKTLDPPAPQPPPETETSPRIKIRQMIEQKKGRKRKKPKTSDSPTQDDEESDGDSKPPSPPSRGKPVRQSRRIAERAARGVSTGLRKSRRFLIRQEGEDQTQEATPIEAPQSESWPAPEPLPPQEQTPPSTPQNKPPPLPPIDQPPPLTPHEKQAFVSPKDQPPILTPQEKQKHYEKHFKYPGDESTTPEDFDAELETILEALTPVTEEGAEESEDPEYTDVSDGEGKGGCARTQGNLVRKKVVQQELELAHQALNIDELTKSMLLPETEEDMIEMGFPITELMEMDTKEIERILEAEEIEDIGTLRDITHEVPEQILVTETPTSPSQQPIMLQQIIVPPPAAAPQQVIAPPPATPPQQVVVPPQAIVQQPVMLPQTFIVQQPATVQQPVIVPPPSARPPPSVLPPPALVSKPPILPKPDIMPQQANVYVPQTTRLPFQRSKKEISLTLWGSDDIRNFVISEKLLGPSYVEKVYFPKRGLMLTSIFVHAPLWVPQMSEIEAKRVEIHIYEGKMVVAKLDVRAKYAIRTHRFFDLKNMNEISESEFQKALMDLDDKIQIGSVSLQLEGDGQKHMDVRVTKDWGIEAYKCFTPRTGYRIVSVYLRNKLLWKATLPEPFVSAVTVYYHLNFAAYAVLTIPRSPQKTLTLDLVTYRRIKDLTVRQISDITARFSRTRHTIFDLTEPLDHGQYIVKLGEYQCFQSRSISSRLLKVVMVNDNRTRITPLNVIPFLHFIVYYYKNSPVFLIIDPEVNARFFARNPRGWKETSRPQMDLDLTVIKAHLDEEIRRLPASLYLCFENPHSRNTFIENLGLGETKVRLMVPVLNYVFSMIEANGAKLLKKDVGVTASSAKFYLKGAKPVAAELLVNVAQNVQQIVYLIYIPEASDWFEVDRKVFENYKTPSSEGSDK